MEAVIPALSNDANNAVVQSLPIVIVRNLIAQMHKPSKIVMQPNQPTIDQPNITIQTTSQPQLTEGTGKQSQQKWKLKLMV